MLSLEIFLSNIAILFTFELILVIIHQGYYKRYVSYDFGINYDKRMFQIGNTK
ncbi:hypothetical protein J27TS8_12910 [Robertmurraya siralis]|uniref:Uncharacterized protein n=1 Tax=Robertmurraya siralis TaxID=77777 RepID=A0A919WGC9_9BACI|nr:hypothetical protein J27TS8_12910 [Robertmurraya siralis]